LLRYRPRTYENFRYRYDKKENPYDKGVLANISEVFCTRMPPSLNNFREWVEISDEPCDEDGPLSSRNKIDLVGPSDLDTGNKGVFNPGVPTILQGIGMGYGEMERNNVNMHIKDRQVAEAPDPLMIPAAVRQHDEIHAGRPEDIHDEVDSSSLEMARFGGNLEW
jgi:palmitoyltransferase ZDHHC9/14/18